MYISVASSSVPVGDEMYNYYYVLIFISLVLLGNFMALLHTKIITGLYSQEGGGVTGLVNHSLLELCYFVLGMLFFHVGLVSMFAINIFKHQPCRYQWLTPLVLMGMKDIIITTF